MTPSATAVSARQLDAHVLSALGILQKIAFAIALPLAILTFIDWIIVPLGDIMPVTFHQMRANNAFMGVVCGISLLLLQPRRSRTMIRVGQSLGAFVVVFAALTLASDFQWIGREINTIFAADLGHLKPGTYPGRVSPEAAFTYLLLGGVIATLRSRDRFVSYFADLLTLSLVFTLANFLARYIFGLTHVFNDKSNPFSIQTYVMLIALTFLTSTRRAEYGLGAILLGRGMGGQFGRLAAPLAFLLPFVFAIGNASLIEGGVLPDSSVTARITSLVAMSFFCFVLFLSARTDVLERSMMEPVLRDDLTQLYNHRGFALHADSAFRLTQREGGSFFVLYLDLDGLRRVNRALGHRTGSHYLCTMAAILEETFPSPSICSRIGSDKFAVAGRGDAQSVQSTIQILEGAAAEATTQAGRPFDITYSLGAAFHSRNEQAGLEPMVRQAERMMSQAKRIKIHQVTQASETSPFIHPALIEARVFTA